MAVQIVNLMVLLTASALLSFISVETAQISQPGVCDHEGAKLAGEMPVRAAHGVLMAPHKVRHVEPNRAKLPKETKLRKAWYGEILLDRSGKVLKVWTIRQVDLEPPSPWFNTVIVRAVRQWKYMPLVVNHEPVPACLAVSYGW